MKQINRREFVVIAAAAAGTLCFDCEARSQTTGPTTSASAKTVDVGSKSDYATDGMDDRFIKTDHIVVTRENGKIFASSSKCTHQGGDVRIQGAQLYCPRHKAYFTAEGANVSGPAKTPLPRFAISTDANGHLIVDLARQYVESQWSEPGSFVPA